MAVTPNYVLGAYKIDELSTYTEKGVSGAPAFSNVYSVRFNSEGTVNEHYNITGVGAGLNGFSAMTLSAWLKIETDQTFHSLIHIGDQATSGKRFTIEPLSTGLRGMSFTCRPNNGESGQIVNFLFPTFEYNTWVHWVASVNLATDTMKFYVNSVEQSGSGTPSFTATSFNANESSSRIGIQESNNGDFRGNIDEMSIFAGIEFSQAQVNEIYNSGSPTDLSTHSAAANLRHWWRFGDDPGDSETTLVDQQGNQNGTGSAVDASDIEMDVP